MTEALVRGKAGMASVKDMPVVQDGPPPGGFAPVRFARRIPNTGPSAMAIFLAAFGVFSYGMYQVGQGNKIRRYTLPLSHTLTRSNTHIKAQFQEFESIWVFLELFSGFMMMDDVDFVFVVFGMKNGQKCGDYLWVLLIFFFVKRVFKFSF